MPLGLALSAAASFLPAGAGPANYLEGVSWAAFIIGIALNLARNSYNRRTGIRPTVSPGPLRKWLAAGLLLIVGVQVIVSIHSGITTNLSHLVTAFSMAAFAVTDTVIVTLDLRTGRALKPVSPEA